LVYFLQSHIREFADKKTAYNEGRLYFIEKNMSHHTRGGADFTELFSTREKVDCTNLACTKKIVVKFDQHFAISSCQICELKFMLELPNQFSGVNFINILHTDFSYESALCSFSLVTFWPWQKDFGQKSTCIQKKCALKCWWNWPQVCQICASFGKRHLPLLILFASTTINEIDPLGVKKLSHVSFEWILTICLSVSFEDEESYG